MNILLFIKHVPSSEDIKFDEKGNMIRENSQMTINLCDDYALENALRIKSAIPQARILAATMGPENAQESLRYCLAKGADKAFLLSDKVLRGADTLITSMALFKLYLKIAQKEGPVKLFLFGAKSSDGETANVPAQFAQTAQIGDICFAEKAESAAQDSITVSYSKNGVYRRIKAPLPCAVSFDISRDVILKMPSIAGKMKAKKAVIESFKAADIGFEPDFNAIEASPTWVGRYYDNKPQSLSKNVKISSIEEIAAVLKKEALK